MSILRAGTLAYIQRTAATFYKDTCLIEKNGETTDGRYGSKTQDWVVVAANVPCRVINLNRSNRSLVEEMANQEVMLESYQLELAYDVEIERDYRVTVNGDVYAVTRIESALTDTVFKQILITRRRG